MALLGAHVPVSLHRDFKIAAAKDGKKLKEALEEAVQMYIDKVDDHVEGELKECL